jgi:hypothetical protein
MLVVVGGFGESPYLVRFLRENLGVRVESEIDGR